MTWCVFCETGTDFLNNRGTLSWTSWFKVLIFLLLLVQRPRVRIIYLSISFHFSHSSIFFLPPLMSHPFSYPHPPSLPSFFHSALTFYWCPKFILVFVPLNDSRFFFSLLRMASWLIVMWLWWSEYNYHKMATHQVCDNRTLMGLEPISKVFELPKTENNLDYAIEDRF
jgi:hypothetical protein